jgi:hypothetical protein
MVRTRRNATMPQGDESSPTDKQRRREAHIEAGYEKKGLSTKTAEARAWATVNKLHRRRQEERLRSGEKTKHHHDSLNRQTNWRSLENHPALVGTRPGTFPGFQVSELPEPH